MAWYDSIFKLFPGSGGDVGESVSGGDWGDWGNYTDPTSYGVTEPTDDTLYAWGARNDVLSSDGGIDWARYDAIDPEGLGNLGPGYGSTDGVSSSGWGDITKILQGAKALMSGADSRTTASKASGAGGASLEDDDSLLKAIMKSHGGGVEAAMRAAAAAAKG